MKYLLIILTLTLIGCSQTDVYEQVDTSEKTILVPPGNNRLVKDCKKILRECGWKTIVKSNHRRVTKFTEDGAESYDKYNARYELLVQSSFIDVGLDFSARIAYSFALIDNDTGEEVFASSGTRSQRQARNEFKDLIGCNAD